GKLDALFYVRARFAPLLGIFGNKACARRNHGTRGAFEACFLQFAADRLRGKCRGRENSDFQSIEARFFKTRENSAVLRAKLLRPQIRYCANLHLTLRCAATQRLRLFLTLLPCGKTRLNRTACPAI